MKRITVITASVCLSLLAACDSGGATAAPAETKAAPAPAQESGGGAPVVDKKMAKAVKERQAVFTLILKNWIPLGGMARGRVPFDAQVVQENSVHVNNLAAMLGDTFVTDTRGSGAQTEALDVIWEQTEKFAQKVAAFESATAALVEVAGSGEEAQIKPSIGRVGKACGSCHDDFRLEDD